MGEVQAFLGDTSRLECCVLLRGKGTPHSYPQLRVLRYGLRHCQFVDVFLVE